MAQAGPNTAQHGANMGPTYPQHRTYTYIYIHIYIYTCIHIELLELQSKHSSAAFVVTKRRQYQQRTFAQGMHEKPQPEGKPLLVTMAVHQPGEGKGKGKDGGWGAAEVGDGGMTCNMVFIRALIPKTKYS